MNQNDLLAYAEETYKQALSLMKSKNSDYANTDKLNDAFRNLALGEHYGVVTTEQGIWTRLSDKFSRLSKIISSGDIQVKQESLNDTAIDMCNYLVLLMAYMESKKKVVTTFVVPSKPDMSIYDLCRTNPFDNKE